MFEFPADSVKAVDAHTKNGSIQVTGSADSGGKLVLRANKRAGAASEEEAKAALDVLRVTAAKTGEGVVRVRWDWSDERSSRRQGQVNYTMEGPAELDVTGETHNGEIVVRGVRGDIKAESHNGRLTVDHQGGRLRGETHNGAITARTTAGRVDLSTHNGRVELAVAGAGELEGRVESHNGGIEVKISPARTGRISLETGNGSVESKLTLQDMKSGGRRLEGRFGEGDAGGSLMVETHNGSIGLDELAE